MAKKTRLNTSEKRTIAAGQGVADEKRELKPENQRVSTLEWVACSGLALFAYVLETRIVAVMSSNMVR